jgi:hypothetical protein
MSLVIDVAAEAAETSTNTKTIAARGGKAMKSHRGRVGAVLCRLSIILSSYDWADEAPAQHASAHDSKNFPDGPLHARPPCLRQRSLTFSG